MRTIKGIKAVARMAKKAGKVPAGFMADMKIRHEYGSLVDFCSKHNFDYHAMFHFCRGQRALSREKMERLAGILNIDFGFMHETQKQFFRR